MSDEAMTTNEALAALDRQIAEAKTIYEDESVPGLTRIAAHDLMLRAQSVRRDVTLAQVANIYVVSNDRVEGRFEIVVMAWSEGVALRLAAAALQGTVNEDAAAALYVSEIRPLPLSPEGGVIAQFVE